MLMPRINTFSAFLLALLFILALWGNALAFFAFGLLTLCAVFFFLKWHVKKVFIIAVTVASFIAILSSIIKFFISR
jgi:hypothetical protein